MAGISALGSLTASLLGSQRAMAATSNNISNVNTAGYTLETVDISQDSGLATATIMRNYDSYLSKQVKDSTSGYNAASTLNTLATQVENTVADPATNLTPQLQAFFNSIQGVSNDPTSTVARQTMISSGGSLAQRFNEMGNGLAGMAKEVDSRLSASVKNINQLVSTIASLNGQIVSSNGQSSGQQPFDLMDQRDQAILSLSKELDVKTYTQPSGAVNVSLSSGQPLVQDGTVSGAIGVQGSAYGVLDPKDVTFTGSGSLNPPIIVTRQIGGGNLNGLINFSTQVLTPAKSKLDSLALGFANQLNTQHKAGTDLNGNAGVDFFNMTVTPTVMGNTNNTGSMTAVIGASGESQLTGTNYQVDMRAGGNVDVTDLTTHAVTTYAATTFSQGGIDFDVSAAGVGDTFHVFPASGAAQSISVASLTASQIAAAASGVAAGTVGDNTNALAMAAMQLNNSSMNGQSYEGVYSSMVSSIGSQVQLSDVNSKAQKGVLDHASMAQSSISGVSLDREAANLMKYQQAYQASAQAISIVNGLFGSLLNAIR